VLFVRMKSILGVSPKGSIHDGLRVRVKCMTTAEGYVSTSILLLSLSSI
jgi:hypothetical protein